MAKTKRISLMLSDNMIKALQAASKRERRPQSMIIRDALSKHLGVEDRVTYGKQDRDTEGQQAALATP